MTAGSEHHSQMSAADSWAYNLRLVMSTGPLVGSAPAGIV